MWGFHQISDEVLSLDICWSVFIRYILKCFHHIQDVFAKYLLFCFHQISDEVFSLNIHWSVLQDIRWSVFTRHRRKCFHQMSPEVFWLDVISWHFYPKFVCSTESVRQTKHFDEAKNHLFNALTQCSATNKFWQNVPKKEHSIKI